VNDDWNTIIRTILPVISQPAPLDDRTNSIGDMVFTAFLSPAKPKKWIWPLSADEQGGSYSNGLIQRHYP